MKVKKIAIAALALLVWGQTGEAQVKANRPDTIGLCLEVPLLDLPYQTYASRTTGNFFAGYANPGMPLSQAMSNNLYTAAHYGIQKAIRPKNIFWRKFLTFGAVLGF
ncbi:MAG: hypothetical protein ACK4NS_13805, partial [Saprospiraceae bacterium]